MDFERYRLVTTVSEKPSVLVGIIQRMRLLKVITILVIGPLLGIASGFIVGGLLLPTDLLQVTAF